MRFVLPPDRGSVRASARAAILSDWMTAWLEEPVQVDVMPTYRALADVIEHGRADLAWTPPALCARVRTRVHALLTVVRYGVTGCRATLVVRSADGLASLADLRGKRAAWVDPLSTNGYLMALAHLSERGHDPAELFSTQRFAGSYRAALADVAEERADVTSMFVVDDDPKMTKREIEDILGRGAERLDLLATTEPAPYDALIISRDAPRAAELEEHLLGLRQSMSPPAMILEVCRADRFVRSSLDEYAQFAPLVDVSSA